MPHVLVGAKEGIKKINTHRHQHFGCSSEEVNGLLVPPDLNYSPEQKTKEQIRLNLVICTSRLRYLLRPNLNSFVSLKYKCMHLMNVKWVHLTLSVRTANIRNNKSVYYRLQNMNCEILSSYTSLICIDSF
jgi:hypothetical protein